MSKAERVAEAQQLWAVEVITTTDSEPRAGRDGNQGGEERRAGEEPRWPCWIRAARGSGLGFGLFPQNLVTPEGALT